MSIPITSLATSSTGSSELLAGEMQDAVVTLHTLASGEGLVRKGRHDRDGVLFVVSGGVNLLSGDHEETATAGTLIRFPYGQGWSVNAVDRTQVLEIRRVLDEEDQRALEKDPVKQAALLLQNIDECPTYREAIKSEKTVNRMLLPEGYVPRLCMGTVQVQGPDDVGAHEHPMLDQLFLGLSNCRCSVYADHDRVILEEGQLLHIPLASRHHVSVNTGDLLHYMWIDFFLTLDGESYMAQAHQMVDEHVDT